MNYEEALKWTDPMETVEPGSDAEKAAMERFKAYFSSVNEATVHAMTRQLYADHVYFNDTLKTLTRAADIERYFARTSRMLSVFSVTLDGVARTGRDYYVCWTMEIKFKRIRKNQSYISHGMSRIRLDKEGRVVFHHDFWDAAKNFFGHIPVLGAAIKLTKKMV